MYYYKILTLFGSGFPWSVYCDFYGFCVCGYLANGMCANAYTNTEGLSSAASADKSQVIKFSYLVFNNGSAVS